MQRNSISFNASLSQILLKGRSVVVDIEEHAPVHVKVGEDVVDVLL